MEILREKQLTVILLIERLEKLTNRKVKLELPLTIEEGEGQLSESDLDILRQFINYCLDNLKIKKIPVIELTIHREEDTTTGGYYPDENFIVTYTKNRHIIDVCRSIGHELMHADQVENDRLDVDGEDSAECPSEIEATVFAAKMMREFSKKHPEIYKEEE